MEPVAVYLGPRSHSISSGRFSDIFNEHLEHAQSYKCRKSNVLYKCLL